MSDEASSTTTWETIVQNYKTRAVRDGARIDELRQSTEHWHDTAQMLKRQRDTAEEEREGWKERALKSEQQRQALRAEVIELRDVQDSQKLRAETAEQFRQALRAVCESFRAECEALHTTNTNLRDQLVIAEGQRDQAKAAEAKRYETVAGAEHRRKLLTALETRCAAAEAERDALRKDAERLDYLDTVRDPYSRRPMREVIGTEWSIVFTHPATHTPTIREAIDTALAVQPTTGDKHE